MSHIHIDINDLHFGYDRDNEILKGIDLHMGEHESVGLVGANGVGKSTLLKLLVGLELSFTGEIKVEELPVEKGTLPTIREKMGYVFQDSDSQLFMSTVYDDVAFAPRNYGLPDDVVNERVMHALEITGITHLKDKHIYKMSGGEKKLASIATILSLTPDIILMDEPSIALDPRNRRNLINVLNDFHHLKIIASHDLDMIMETCERTILMAGGKVIADGPTKDILTNKELLEANGLELPFCMQGVTLKEPAHSHDHEHGHSHTHTHIITHTHEE